MVAALTSPAPDAPQKPAIAASLELGVGVVSTSGRGGLHEDVERVLFSEADIARRTAEIGRWGGRRAAFGGPSAPLTPRAAATCRQLAHDYQGKAPLILAVRA
jgi:hypothetical protein